MKYFECIDPEKIIPISRSTTEVFNTGTWGAHRPEHREKVSPCRVACPAGNNITQALLRLSQGDSDGALAAFLEESPLPGVCGRVCYHPCQVNCNRGKWDGEVSIRALERSASDLGNAHPVPLTERGKDHSVAVIGSGPAGLSAAYHLARMGHPVTIFESENELGGLLRWAIPQYRLPRMALDRDLERILELNIEVRTRTPLVDGEMLAELCREYSTVFLGVGARQSLTLDIPGMGAKGICTALEFLKDISRDKVHVNCKKVVVIGGGNVAIDTALTCKRLGVERVDLVSLEDREEMPAHEREQGEALEEGIEFHNGWGPKCIMEKDGIVSGIEFVECISVYNKEGGFDPVYRESSMLYLECDSIILAIGQAPDYTFLQNDRMISLGEECLRVDTMTMEVQNMGIFAGGDFVNRPGSVVEAIADGKRAALTIHSKAMGKDLIDWSKTGILGGGPSFSIHALFYPRDRWDPGATVSFEDIETMFLDHRPPIVLSKLDPEDRLKDFSEINLSLDADQTEQEARRCFFCGTCTACDRCYIYCPDVSIIPPEEGHGIYEVDSDHCKGCAVCESVCTHGVMRMVEGV